MLNPHSLLPFLPSLLVALRRLSPLRHQALARKDPWSTTQNPSRPSKQPQPKCPGSNGPYTRPPIGNAPPAPVSPALITSPVANAMLLACGPPPIGPPVMMKWRHTSSGSGHGASSANRDRINHSPPLSRNGEAARLPQQGLTARKSASTPLVRRNRVRIFNAGAPHWAGAPPRPDSQVLALMVRSPDAPPRHPFGIVPPPRPLWSPHELPTTTPLPSCARMSALTRGLRFRVPLRCSTRQNHY